MELLKKIKDKSKLIFSFLWVIVITSIAFILGVFTGDFFKTGKSSKVKEGDINVNNPESEDNKNIANQIDDDINSLLDDSIE